MHLLQQLTTLRPNSSGPSGSDDPSPGRDDGGMGPDFVPDLPVRAFRDHRAFERWLDRNHARSSGLWLKIAKRDSGIASVNHAEALETALCFGWIDGQRRKLDDTHFLQRFTPRRPRSMWSKINCTKATELIASGRMRPAGRRRGRPGPGRRPVGRRVRRSAERDRSRRAAAGARREPASAREFFATLDSRNRYAFIWRVQEAKKPETRQRRAEQFVKMLAAGEVFHDR